MCHLYLDESGDLGLGDRSSRHLLICIIKVCNLPFLKSRMKREIARLYNKGWPKELEIKATSIWQSQKDSRTQHCVGDRWSCIHTLLNSFLHNTDIFYCAVHKANLSIPPRGMRYLYNHLCGELLADIHPCLPASNVHLFADARSKAIDSKEGFETAVNTALLVKCGHQFGFHVNYMDSTGAYGLKAVDFVSWALFRHHEHGDSSFLESLKPNIKIARTKK